MGGPLVGLRVVELAGIGPAPFCGMVLADLGADVIRVDRVGDVVGHATPDTRSDFFSRGKRSIALDLKREEGAGIVLDLVEESEALIEGFRPGVTERLGIGPADTLARNPALVYGRMTGWGQTGPLSSSAGHDIDYIALSGALHAIGTESSPVVPLNLVGDYGGGGMLGVVGVLAALLRSSTTGVGQVVDAAMVDGAALLNTQTMSWYASGRWENRRAVNLLDGGAPFYAVYETADSRHMAVGALEPQFYSELLRLLGLNSADLPDQSDREGWALLRETFAQRFRSKTRDEWAELFEGSDACVAPVLSFTEAPGHPHNRARRVFDETGPFVQPRPAPRFSVDASEALRDPCFPGRDTDDVLHLLGLEPELIGKLRAQGSVA